MQRENAFDPFFRSATGYAPYPYQRRLAAHGFPDLLRVPTGAGKTAGAVLAWLYRRRVHPDLDTRKATPRRLVYCLPMRVLVEQTHRAVSEWLQRLGLEDEVGLHLLMGGAAENDWVLMPERNAVLVGTMDMLLSRALNRGYGLSRFRWPVEFGLVSNDSLWVLDEVQLMGNGLTTSAQAAAFVSAFGTAGPWQAMWMSATLEPEWLETADHANPGGAARLTSADRAAVVLRRRLNAVKRVSRLGPLGALAPPRAIARAVQDHHEPGTLTLVVLNAVERTRAAYRALRGLRRGRDGVEILLLHSRFRPPERRALVERLRAPLTPEGRVTIATQVVEAGIDISAKTLITEVAPVPSLVQRFGRCHRYGEYREGKILWLDVPDESSAPYRDGQIAEGRKFLRRWRRQSASPRRLEAERFPPPAAATHVPRRRDLLDLFDTAPDLSGNDLDVSRFIRDDADIDVEVFWRDIPPGGPTPDEPRAARDELCAVPVYEVRRYLENPRRPAWRFDTLDDAWLPVQPRAVRPGMMLLLAADAGGYDAEVGFDAAAVGPVAALPTAPGPAAAPEESVTDDPGSRQAWIPLSDHLKDVEEEAARLWMTFAPGLDDAHRSALLSAARWHDLGKAHPVFQATLLRAVPSEEAVTRRSTLWAKSPRLARHARRYFRHELVTALMLLQAPDLVADLPESSRDLALYLVAAHHGRVRLSIRSLPDEDAPPVPFGPRYAMGVWDGEQVGGFTVAGQAVPTISLDLSVMEMGLNRVGQRSWTDRALGLLDSFGPFRLAFLEALLRVADWRVSGGYTS